MLRAIIAVALGAGLAKKAWDHRQASSRRPPEDITDLVARPEAAAPAKRRKPAKKGGSAGNTGGRRKDAPGA